MLIEDSDIWIVIRSTVTDYLDDQIFEDIYVNIFNEPVYEHMSLKNNLSNKIINQGSDQSWNLDQ